MLTNQTKDSTQTFDYDVAMRRVIYLAVIGAVIVLVYSESGAWIGGGHFASVFSLSLMAACAAMVSGGLLGFLFGVPHVREGETAQTPSGERNRSEDSGDERDSAGSSITYRPNTSLEQISDWLTKMLVGVGLVEIKAIPGKLKGAANFVAKGLGNNEQAQAFALTLLIFFAICGFVFGYLWARLYLKRWFDDADRLRALGKKVDQLEMDARALALITHKLADGIDDATTDPKLIEEAISTASPRMRAQIFSQAEAASENRGAKDYQLKLRAAISVFKGLIKSDLEQQYDRNHQELAQALQRQDPPDPEEALREITRAIDIRTNRKKDGWQFYESLRAQWRIQQDQNYKNGRPSDEPLVKQILNDLRIASTDTTDETRWAEWSKYEDVVKWMNLNRIDVSTLESRR
jgi:hypothetical protein